MTDFHPKRTFAGSFSFLPMRPWLLFWLFVIISWTAVGFYLLVSGWAPCAKSGTCVVDGFVMVLALLIMPTQVLLAVYLKQRRSD